MPKFDCMQDGQIGKCPVRFDGGRNWNDRAYGCLKTTSDKDVNFNWNQQGKATNEDQTTICRKNPLQPHLQPTRELEVASIEADNKKLKEANEELRTLLRSLAN